MAEYRSNSNKAVNGEIAPVEADRRVEPVVSGSASVQKKTGIGRFTENLIATSASDLGAWVLSDVIIPKVKDTISAVFKGGIDMLLYGKADSGRSSLSSSKVSYGSFYSNGRNESLRAGTTTSAFDYDNIIFDSRGDAEAVLSTMRDILDQCESVSVSDLYDLADVPAPSYTATKYGWTSLQTAQVMRCVDGGYVIKLPRAKAIG